MAAAARVSAAAATFPDIKQSYLRVARQWTLLSNQMDCDLDRMADAQAPICFCGALLTIMQEPNTGDPQ
jgi:hypothetical protein